MSYDFRFMIYDSSNFQVRASVILSFLCILCSFFSTAQVKSSIDSTKIKIGEQITYKIEVEADTTSMVVFPEGQTFSPLEMIGSYEVDTTKQNAIYHLVKKYALTQFDSGRYTIPRQKIIIGDNTFYTDSLRVEVNEVAVDTTEQGLYDIKPYMEVEKSSSNWWKILLIVLLALTLIGFLLYWFIWRKKPLTEEEEIALLPPYERAKLALKKLDESNYLEQSALKDYYSELTFIIRKYLDEKVYDRALESTTDELIQRLNLLRDGNQIELSNEDIRNIQSILKRADLVKFAKSAPDIELAKIDRNTIDMEIDHVKEALPEPSEEEKLLNQQYKEEQETRKKRRKIIITVVIALFVIMATFAGFVIKYGYDYVKDTIVGNDSKELLEGDWVRSEYGVPPIYISTPEVLRRMDSKQLPTLNNEKVTVFGYGTLLGDINIALSTTKVNLPDSAQVDMNVVIENTLKLLENNGVKNLITKSEKYVTPNNAEGIKVYGTGDFPQPLSENLINKEYVILLFNADKVVQRIMLVWKKDDVYADDIMERILNSIELNKIE